MSENNQFHFEIEQDMMILSLESDFDVLGIDENCNETSMLLTSFDEEGKQENKHNSSYSTVLTECSSTIHMGDDDGFLDADRIGEILPAKVSSHITVKEDSEQSTPTDKDTPGKFDVLCGQSRVCANHTGNKRFQAVLDLYAPKYDAVSSKQEKMTLTKEIVSRIGDAGGHFLKYKEGRWQEISTVTARDKVSHALRTKVASWKRQQEQAKTEGDCATASATPTKGKPGHRRKRSGNSPRHRNSSCSSINTCSSDIVTSSFDGSDPSSNTLIEDLLKTQREIFANLQKDSASPAEHPLKRSSR